MTYSAERAELWCVPKADAAITRICITDVCIMFIHFTKNYKFYNLKPSPISAEFKNQI